MTTHSQITFGTRIINFLKQLNYTGSPLPKGIRVMNLFVESDVASKNIKSFAELYLDDTNQRHIILGINPSRLGAGVTGIPFILII